MCDVKGVHASDSILYNELQTHAATFLICFLRVLAPQKPWAMWMDGTGALPICNLGGRPFALGSRFRFGLLIPFAFRFECFWCALS